MKPKKIKQSIESLEKQKEKHLEKINSYDGNNYALIDYRKQKKNNFVFCPINSLIKTKSFWYWKKEINQFEDKIKELKDKLEEK